MARASSAVAALTGAGLVLTPAGAAAQASGESLIAFAHSATPTTVTERTWDGVAWSAGLPAGALGSDLRQLDVSSGRATDPVVLLTVDDGRVLRLHVRESGVWDAGRVVSADTGTGYAPVARAAHEGASGDVLIVYRSAAASTLRFRTLTDGVLSAEASAAIGLAGAPDLVVVASHPNSDRIGVLARSGRALAAVVWDGAGFGPPATLSSDAMAIGRTCDIAYESGSGHLLAAWSEGASIRYAARTGSWSGAAAAVTPGGQVNNLRLAPSPSPASDAVLLCYQTSSGVVGARPWTGAAWSVTQSLDTQGHGGLDPRVDAAWQRDGGAAVVLWARQGASQTRSRSWDGAGWSAEATGPAMGSVVRRVRVATGESGDEVIAACLLSAASGSIDDYLVYGDSVVATGSATVHGPYAANAPGTDLPVSPGSGYGATTLTYGNNQVATLAPGDYGDCGLGHGCTINLTSGTYRFKTFDIAGRNNISIIADTAAGDVSLIIAEGSFEPQNNFTALASGGGALFLHVLGGDLDLKNNATLTGVHARVYAGDITIGASLSATGSLWASGTVQLGSGDVYAYAVSAGSPGPLGAFALRGGLPGASAMISSSITGAPMWDVYEPQGPGAGTPRITQWREVDPAP